VLWRAVERIIPDIRSRAEVSPQRCCNVYNSGAGTGRAGPQNRYMLQVHLAAQDRGQLEAAGSVP
jgi:hypothetical protein